MSITILFFNAIFRLLTQNLLPMEKLQSFRLCFVILLIGILYSCEEDLQIPELEPEAQEIEFNISYAGTAITFLGQSHKLYYLVDYEKYSPYSNFYSLCSSNDFEGGLTDTSPYKFEPGTYEISGFWDWNDSDTWESYEPIIKPVIVEVNGLETTKVDIYLEDKTSPSDKGWIEGSISCSKTGVGAHHVYCKIYPKGESYLIQDFCVTNNPYEFSNGDLHYSSDYLEPNNFYMVQIYWDLNDNEEYDSGEPTGIDTYLYISPGLPTVRNFNIN